MKRQQLTIAHRMNIKPKTAIVIAGPTAIGKTHLAIQLALHFGTKIVSADSRQCYAELNIGVAKPSLEELQTVPHYFINSHSIHQQVDAAVYEQYALDSLSKIFEQSDTAIVVGGTGLYIKALCEGVDEMPPIPENIREEVRNGFREYGIEWLRQEVSQLDPLYFQTGEIQNPHRLMRALEFFKTTGQSIRTYQKGSVKERPFNIIKIGLQLPKEELYQRIHTRVDQMILQGQVEEVRNLLPYQHLKALQTVGYKEIFDHLNGLCSLDAAIEFIKTSTRQYAKRQMTWFKKDVGFEWFSPFEYENIIAFLNKKVI